MDPTYEIPESVVARTVGDEVVILDLESGTYFGLDPVGARIWQLMRDGLTLARICDVLTAEYAAGRDVVERDVRSLAAELAAEKLIEVQG